MAKTKESAEQSLRNRLLRHVDKKTIPRQSVDINYQKSKVEKKLREDAFKVNALQRQEFTAVIMSKLSDLTADNVYFKDHNYASKFPEGASKKVIKRYKVWINLLNEVNKPPNSFGAAFVDNKKTFSKLNDIQIDNLAKDTLAIQDLKTAYIEVQPGVANGFNEFPDIGDEVSVITTEQQDFEDVKIIRILSKIRGSQIFPGGTIKKNKVGLSRPQLTGVVAASVDTNAQATAQSLRQKLEADPNASLTEDENRLLQSATFASIVGTTDQNAFTEQSLSSRTIVGNVTTGDILNDIADGQGEFDQNISR